MADALQPPMPVQPTTPPTRPGSVPPTSQSSWPTVLGVIAIVLGSLGALGGVWGAIAPFFFDAISKVLPDEAAAQFDAIQQWRVWIVVSSLIMSALAVFLLVSGIGLLKRRRASPRWARTWAILKIIYVPISVAFQMQMQKDQFQAIPQMQGNNPLPASMMSLIVAASIVFGVLWGWALPVFMLIWLGRKKIRQEAQSWD